MAGADLYSPLIESRADLIEVLARGAKPREHWRIGTEHEKHVFHREPLRPVGYGGPNGIRALLGSMFVMFEKFTLTLTDIYDLLDPNMLVARYRGDALGRAKPVVYQNDYIGVFEFRDGKITLWREFDNPQVSAAMIAEFADDVGASS